MKNEKTIIMKDNNEYSLTNLDNYKTTIDNSLQEVLYKYINLIIEYIKYITDRITINDNNYYKFIIERGLHTISHVFQIIFYYTKNLELTTYHTQKAYYFYIEFIEQITDDNITFLKLSSRDAILFVYKRTLFEINNDIKKNNYMLLHDDKLLIQQIDSYVSIYKNIMHFIIYHKDFNKEDYIKNNCTKLEEFHTLINKSKIKKNYIDCIFHFSILVNSYDISFTDFFDILTEFIKELSVKRKHFNEKILMNKILQIKMNEDIKEYNCKTIINYIFSNDET